MLPAVFAGVVAHFEKRGEIASTGSWLRLPHHVPRLSPEHEALWALVRPRLSGENRFNPPRVPQLCEDLRRRQGSLRQESLRGLMKRLARRGDVHEVAEDQFLHGKAVAELADMAVLTGAAHGDGWFNAAAYRDHLGIGRKMAILILEFFDRQGLTIRKGDLRRIDPGKRRMFQESAGQKADPSEPHQASGTQNL